MPLVLPLRLMALLLVRPSPPGSPASIRKPNLQLDLCTLSRYMRRDLGFETFNCETREDWRSFR